ncbi:hypothetical protein [Spiroplasma endosymbiont of Othius punctulatus]|uniref:hypothetical protein n=1 Tax=Spiroplasma endosymbiont of Othius punctulatus TaxID=3066289 RepID=UPI0030D168BA
MKIAKDLIKNINKFVGKTEEKGNFKSEDELDKFLTTYVEKKLRDIWVQRLYLSIPWLIHFGVLAMFVGLSFIWIDSKDGGKFSIGKFFYWFMVSLAISALLRLITVTVNMFSRVKYNDKKMRRVAPKVISSYFMFKDKSFKSVTVKKGKFKPFLRRSIKKIEIETDTQVFSYDLWEKKKFSFLLFFLGFFVSFVKTILKYIRVFKGSFLKSKYVVSQEVKLSYVSEKTKLNFKEHKKELTKEGFSIKGDKVVVNRKKVTWSQKGLQVTDIQIYARHKPEMKPEIYKILDEKLVSLKGVMTKMNDLTY